MNDELKEKIRAAREVVNAAVAPYGYKARDCMDAMLAEEAGEAWFVLESTRAEDKPHKDFFEACYYLHGSATNARREGTVIYGVQGEGDWHDLPADPAAACAAFREENNKRADI